MTKEFLNDLFLYLESIYKGNVVDSFGDNDWFFGEAVETEKQYTIIDIPKGEKQEIDLEEFEIDSLPKQYNFITHVYVCQWRDGGMAGDDFAGDYYFPLPNNQYMKVKYTC